MLRNLPLLLIAFLALCPGRMSAQDADTSVVLRIASTDTLSTLALAVDTTGVDAALEGDGPFTVFAPSNDAFAAIPAATLDSLLGDPGDTLTAILQYHVVAGTLMAADLMKDTTLMTLQGGMLTVTVMNDTVMINDAHVIIADLMASNGVVHVIDMVLMPEATTSNKEPEFARGVAFGPNPASSALNVTLPPSIAGRATLTLRDFNGRTVLTRRSAGEREPLDVGNLAAGPYLLEIRADAGVILRKVMVQR